MAHQNLLRELISAGFTDDGEGNLNAPEGVRRTIKQQNADLVEEGLVYLNRADTNRPDNDDTMAYMNLLYRLKASVDSANASSCKDDLVQARAWAAKGMATRKVRDEKRQIQPTSRAVPD